MSTAQLVRAWSDPTYRKELQREGTVGATMHPAGDVDQELAQLLAEHGSPLMAGTSTCTSTCTCTASAHSGGPCCC